MATTITIPLGNDPFECTVNGVYYSYAAGTTVEVPDEVAALIQSIEGNDPPKTVPAPPVMPRGGSVGDVLTRTADGAEWAATSGGGGGGAFVVHDDVEGTLDKTWQEIYNALDGSNIVIIKSGDIAYRFVSSIASVHGSYMLSALGDEYGEITAYFYSAEGADAYPTLVTE